jgi:hypothetical protein
MDLLQVVSQQRGGPDRRAIPTGTRILAQDRIEQGGNDALDRPGPTATGGVHEVTIQIAPFVRLHPGRPIINGLTTDP